MRPADYEKSRTELRAGMSAAIGERARTSGAPSPSSRRDVAREPRAPPGRARRRRGRGGLPRRRRWRLAHHRAGPHAAGVPEVVANGTSRLGIVLQNWSQSCDIEPRGSCQRHRAMAFPTLIGAVIGALLAIWIPGASFRWLFGRHHARLGRARSPARDRVSPPPATRPPARLARLGPLLAIGIYGGFAQARPAIFSSRSSPWEWGVPLKKANILKVVLTAPTAGRVRDLHRQRERRLGPRGALVDGQMTGGWVGAGAVMDARHRPHPRRCSSSWVTVGRVDLLGRDLTSGGIHRRRGAPRRRPRGRRPGARGNMAAPRSAEARASSGRPSRRGCAPVARAPARLGWEPPSRCSLIATARSTERGLDVPPDEMVRLAEVVLGHGHREAVRALGRGEDLTRPRQH